MMRRLLLMAMAFLACGAPAAAVPGGAIGTLHLGSYVCELPGDALGPSGQHVASADFSIVTASSYRTEGGMGSYLLTGDQLVLTSGPRKGERYRRVSRGSLRQQTDDGSDGKLRCVLSQRNNTPRMTGSDQGSGF